MKIRFVANTINNPSDVWTYISEIGYTELNGVLYPTQTEAAQSSGFFMPVEQEQTCELVLAAALRLDIDQRDEYPPLYGRDPRLIEPIAGYAADGCAHTKPAQSYE